MSTVNVIQAAKDGSKTTATVEIKGTTGQVTMYSDGSLTSNPAWLISKAASRVSDANLAVRKALLAIS